MKYMQSNHRQLVNGIGKCSVPMFRGDLPAGFCNEPAYGNRPNSSQFWNYPAQRFMRMDGKYDGYVPGLACPTHGGPNKSEIE